MSARLASLISATCLALWPLGDVLARASLDLTPCELRGSGGTGRTQAYCGTLRVPEDPADPVGRTLELFVARLPALEPAPPRDAFVIINGGPGASSIDLLMDLPGAFRRVREERDLIVVDQRGTGRSAALTCDTPEQPISTFDAAAVRAATRRCLDSLNADPRFYTTSLAVADLEQLRIALGYDRWTLYGVSYGTRVAQHYLRRYPDAVRALVLDGVLPPDQALGPDIALNAQNALDALFERCARDPACRQRFGQPRARFAQLAERLRLAPVSLAFAHPLTAEPTTPQLGYEQLAGTLRLLTYAPETAALVPLLIDEAETRQNYTPLALQAQRIDRELTGAINLPMHNTVVCSEDVPFYPALEPLQPALEATYLGPDQVRTLQTICAEWPSGPVDQDLRTPLHSAVPVLLLSGEFDPVTPPGYAQRAAVGLTGSRHVVAPGQGHGVVGRGCLPDVLADFVSAGTTVGLDTACVARLAPEPFFIDLLGPAP